MFILEIFFVISNFLEIPNSSRRLQHWTKYPFPGNGCLWLWKRFGKHQIFSRKWLPPFRKLSSQGKLEKSQSMGKKPPLPHIILFMENIRLDKKFKKKNDWELGKVAKRDPFSWSLFIALKGNKIIWRSSHMILVHCL